MAHKVYLVYENPETGDWTYNGVVMRRWSYQSALTYYVVAPGVVAALAAAAQRRWFDPEISELQIGIVTLKSGERYYYPIGRWSRYMPFYPFDRFKTVLRLMRHMQWYAQRRLAEPDEDLFSPIAASVLSTLDELGSAPLVEHRFTKRRYRVVPVGPDEPFHAYRLALADPDGCRFDRVWFAPEDDTLRGAYMTDVDGSTSWRPTFPRKQPLTTEQRYRYLIDTAVRNVLDGREFFFAPVASTADEPDGLAWRFLRSSHRRLASNRKQRRV